ncbi:MAG: hypothetical protein AB1798_08030, partial [Spirochaetota bacterium]
MKNKFNLKISIFALRSLVLFFLLLNYYFHLKSDLEFIFVTAVFLAAVALALFLEKSRIRLIPACLSAAVFPWFLRFLIFFVFRIRQEMVPAPEADFQFFLFDRNFFPLLPPYFIILLFTFLSLRFPAFIVWEVILNAVLYTALFFSQAQYKITLYPHPSLLALAAGIFIILEAFILFFRFQDDHSSGVIACKVETTSPSIKQVFSGIYGFIWVIIPLMVVFFLFILGKYSEGAIREGGGLLKPTLFRFDFTKYITLKSEISVNDDLVLLFRKQGPADRLLLRRFVLSGFRAEAGFFYDSAIDGDKESETVPDHPKLFPDLGFALRENLDQEYFLVAFDPSSLVAMNYPIEVVPYKTWDASSFNRIYRVVSKVARALPWELTDIPMPDLDRKSLKYYTEDGHDLQILRLAEEITG